jgi:hypothetical protein
MRTGLHSTASAIENCAFSAAPSTPRALGALPFAMAGRPRAGLAAKSRPVSAKTLQLAATARKVPAKIDYAALLVCVCLRFEAAEPTTDMPTANIAQLLGSGTALTVVTVAKNALSVRFSITPPITPRLLMVLA